MDATCSSETSCGLHGVISQKIKLLNIFLEYFKLQTLLLFTSCLFHYMKQRHRFSSWEPRSCRLRRRDLKRGTLPQLYTEWARLVFGRGLVRICRVTGFAEVFCALPQPLSANVSLGHDRFLRNPFQFNKNPIILRLVT
jgi:hypothetical protein